VESCVVKGVSVMVVGGGVGARVRRQYPMP